MTKEKPILFSAPMVRALLDGSKSQTRRAVKLRNGQYMPPSERADVNGWRQMLRACPYGQPGDSLWVRESHWWFKDEPDHSCGYYPPKLTAEEDVVYRADGDDGRKVWRPSIHMPRWASRITLEITGVRVDRLKDISETDAIAEGLEREPGTAHWKQYDKSPGGWRYWESPIQSYRTLWESINGPGSWEANPWVWVIEFRRVES